MKARSSLFIFFLLILFIVLLPLMLNARAGGGHSFGGSSHSTPGFGSLGGSGGGSSVDVIYLIILLVRYPHIGVPLALGGIVFFYFMGRGVNRYHINSTIRKAGALSADLIRQLREQNMKRLKQADPDFSEESFIRRAEMAFMTIQRCWSDQDLTPMRQFVSNGLFSRFEIQIDMQKREGFRNQLEDINILSSSIACISADNLYDRIDVAFSATMEDKDVDLKNGRVLRKNESGPFVEYWTFLRRKGGRSSQNKNGLIEGKCPNCGANLKISESGNCEFCKSFVVGGQYDWVLTEITQEEEYTLPSEQNETIPGLREMISKDPDFNIAVIEDKVSYIFFRMVRTNYFGDIKYIKGVSHPNYCNSIVGIFRPEDEWYQSLLEPAVGAVEVKRIIIDGGDGFDKVDVMVRWSARYCERNRKTNKMRNIQEKSIRTQTYTLVRRSDVRTKANYNFAIIPCRFCGAPLSSGVEDKCEYCGTIINDGSRDWVLYSVDIYRPYNFSTSYSGVNRQGNENRLILSAMIAGMLADGVMDDREREMIYWAAQNRGVSKEVVDQMIESAKRGELVANPSNEVEARSMLSSMARVVVSDGRISNEEYNMLLKFGARYNYKKSYIDSIINIQRKLLFREARSFIKNTRV